MAEDDAASAKDDIYDFTLPSILGAGEFIFPKYPHYTNTTLVRQPLRGRVVFYVTTASARLICSRATLCLTRSLVVQ